MFAIASGGEGLPFLVQGGYPSEGLGVSSAERWTAERGKPSGVEAERVQKAWSVQHQTGSLQGYMLSDVTDNNP